MVKDYSQPISSFTEFHAYPLLHVHEVAYNIIQYKVLMTLELRKAVGHYSRWAPNFSEKCHFSHDNGFPLSGEALQAFGNMKKDVANTVVLTIEPTTPFRGKPMLSDHTMAATLTQNGRPVANVTPSHSERGHSSVEKKLSL